MTEQPKDLASRQPLKIGREAGRIAGALAGVPLHSGYDRTDPPANVDGRPDVSIGRVRFAIRAHRLRKRYFNAPVFDDVPWDMMLVLFETALAGGTATIFELERWPGLSRTSAMRWLNTLTHYGLVLRKADPADPGRMIAELSPEALAAMRCYFADLSDSPAA